MAFTSFIKQTAGWLFPVSLLLVSCSGTDEKKDTLPTDSTAAVQSVSEGPDRTYNYRSQLFKIDPLEFRLNQDDLPFPFNEQFLKENKVKSISMSMHMKEGKFQSASDFKWDVNESGQVVRETRLSGKKVENAIEKFYSNGLLSEMHIANPGEKFETSIKKVKYSYANNRLISVHDIFENGDSVQTDYIYKDGRLSEKRTLGKEGMKGKTMIYYFEGRPVKMEFYKGEGVKNGEKGAIYNYTYTRKGKLLYGDHWYPGISNDTYIFEFDDEDRLVEITYKIFLKKEELKIPGKTKSYRFEYEKGMLKRINYFMQANTFTQSGTFEFTYQYYP